MTMCTLKHLCFRKWFICLIEEKWEITRNRHMLVSKRRINLDNKSRINKSCHCNRGFAACAFSFFSFGYSRDIFCNSIINNKAIIDWLERWNSGFVHFCNFSESIKINHFIKFLWSRTHSNTLNLIEQRWEFN